MLNGLARKAHGMAVEKGWYEQERGFAELIALCHSELSEALEAYRDCGLTGFTWTNEYGKPEGVPIELADAIIRILDMCDFYDIDIDDAILRKMAYNATRPVRHGGKAL